MSNMNKKLLARALEGAETLLNNPISPQLTSNQDGTPMIATGMIEVASVDNREIKWKFESYEGARAMIKLLAGLEEIVKEIK